MESINQVILQGHLPRDARISPSKRGGQYAMFSLATTEKWIDKATKEQKSKTQYHNCTAWSVAPSEADFLKKAATVRVEGKVEYSVKRDEKTGQDRNYCNIIVDYLEFIPSDGSRRSAPRQQQEGQPSQDQQSSPPPVDDSDLPF